MKNISVGLIDADIFRYEIGSIEMPHPFLGADVTTPCSELKIEEALDGRIEGIKQAIGCDRFVFLLTGSGNFRNEISDLEPYKGNRSNASKPYHWGTVDSLLKEKYGAIECTGNEADDALALTARKEQERGNNPCICSRDKDLRMVQGWHYSWPCGEHQPEKPLYYISALEGERWFWTQMLTGDSTDNIMGCGQRFDKIYKSGAKKGQPYRTRNGVGPKDAESTLRDCKDTKEFFKLVRGLYIKHFGDDAEKRMIEMGRLLYIGQTPTTLWELPYGFTEEL